MRITVYLGSNPGNDPRLTEAVRELGAWIGKSGHTLVYGGARFGLMRALADSVLQAGGRVIGVMPRFFVDEGRAHDKLTELIVTEDMSSRKAAMIALGDAFLAFAGGFGTLEEITEVLSKVALGQLDAPCMLYDLDGYYTGLKTQLLHAVETGLASEATLSRIRFVKTLDEIKAILAE